MPQPLQQLGIRIDGGEDVKASEVKKAYSAEIEAIKKVDASPAGQRYILQLERTRDRLLKQLDDLHAAKKKNVEDETTRLRLRLVGEIKQSIGIRKKFDATRENVNKRLGAVTKATTAGEAMTDPTARGARIPDYEGYGLPWQSGYGDENVNNKTRWTLAGWLSAFSLRGGSFAGQELAKAVAIYEKSDSGWLTVDASLNYEEMKSGMKMVNHISSVGRLGLAPESEGFAAGYLAVGAAQLNKKQAIEYKDYFLKGLKSLGNELNYKRPEGLPDNQYEHKKGRHQMKVIGRLMTPTEWMEQHEAAKKAFLDLRADASTISKNLGIEFKDPTLKALLLREKGSFTHSDLSDIDAARETVRREAAEYLKGVHDQLMEKHKEVSTEADKMFERNKKLKHLSKEDISAIKEQLKYAKKEVKKILVSESDPLGEMTKVGKEVNTVRGYIGSISIRVSQMNNTMDAEEKHREEEKERKKKAEERRKRRAAAAGATGSGAGKKKSKESKEIKEGLAEFLSDKNLEEKTVDNGYEYSLGRPNIHKSKTNVQIDWKNPEVDKHFGKQLNAYLLAASAALTPQKRKKLKTFLAQDDNSLNTLFSFLGTMGEISTIIDQAVKESTLKFPGKPSTSRIKSVYNKKFVSAWKKAGKRLDAIVGDTLKKSPKKNTQRPQKSTGTPEMLRFLGNVDPRYVHVMHQIAYYGDRPEGLTIQLPFSPGFTVPTSFRRSGNIYIFDYPGGRVRYTRIEDALRDINVGNVHQRYIDGILRMEGPYKQYEKSVGELDENQDGRTPGEIQLEFDWTNPDPDVYVRALPHGKIVYTVSRENIGPYGENFRSLYADNFKDFMIQMAHLRKWAEGPKHRNRETVGSRRELLFNIISNPFFFRNRNISTRIGNVVSFEMLQKSEATRMYLDWGGGENRLSPKNAMLNIWVTKRGELMYTLNGPGVNVPRMRAANLEAIILDVEQRRKG